MTKSLVTKKLSNHVAEQVIESITEPANSVYYIVASRHTPYTGGDATIPAPTESVQDAEVAIYEEMVFGKKVTSSDIMHMIPRVSWTSGTVYDQYDHEDGSLFTKQFYAAANNGSYYYVYKVLDNNGGANSTVSPISNVSESACNFTTTADGYKWKLMYTMPVSTFDKFATADYMPVQTSANVAGNTVAGAIDVITVDYAGSDYVANLTDTFNTEDIRFNGVATDYRLSTSASSNNEFYTGSAMYLSSGTGAGQIRKIFSYNAVTRVAVVNSAFTTPPDSTTTYIIAPLVTIQGDGSGASGYANVASGAGVNNYIYNVVVVDRGNNYTYATATVTGNTGGLSNTATVRPIIPPVGGHGYDSTSELGSSQLGISVSFNTSESGFISVENDYRTIGILKDPKFNNVTMTMTGESGTFVASENVHQVKYSTITGTVSISTSSNTVTGTDTNFLDSVYVGDKVILFDTVNNLQCLRTVTSVTNSVSLSVDSNPSFQASLGKIATATILCTGIKAGNSSPYITLNSTEPKFVTGKRIIGESSGAWANVSAIAVQEKSYNNWLTFDNRVRINYSANVGVMTEDSAVYQSEVYLSNAYFHSANSTHIFLTRDRGPITAATEYILRQVDGSSTFTLGTTKYQPDIKKGSGQLIYIENTDPISRSGSQSETVKIILNF